MLPSVAGSDSTLCLGRRIFPFMQPNLSPEEYAALAGILRDMIAADRFPLSPRVRSWRAILDKLEPPAPRIPLPPLKPPREPSMVVARMRGERR